MIEKEEAGQCQPQKTCKTRGLQDWSGSTIPAFAKCRQCGGWRGWGDFAITSKGSIGAQTTGLHFEGGSEPHHEETAAFEEPKDFRGIHGEFRWFDLPTVFVTWLGQQGKSRVQQCNHWAWEKCGPLTGLLKPFSYFFLLPFHFLFADVQSVSFFGCNF